ncbi:MAG: ATP-binding protein, partial [Myxococcales bacterium]|nr:ATP-binding protein [Myxococcales bacterium]
MDAVHENPFPGLRAFEVDEDHLFFGRDEQVDQLLTRLRETRFLAIVGASGSGKSSLTRSGLIPSLHSGFMASAGSSWRIAVTTPGDDPIGNLTESL